VEGSRSLFRILTFRREFEDGMSEELRFHMEQFADDLVSRGVAPEEASRLARIDSEACRMSRATAARRAVCTCWTSFCGNCDTPPACCEKRPDSQPQPCSLWPSVSGPTSRFRRDGLHPAPPAPVSRGQPPGHNVQHLPESGR